MNAMDSAKSKLECLPFELFEIVAIHSGSVALFHACQSFRTLRCSKRVRDAVIFHVFHNSNKHSKPLLGCDYMRPNSAQDEMRMLLLEPWLCYNSIVHALGWTDYSIRGHFTVLSRFAIPPKLFQGPFTQSQGDILDLIHTQDVPYNRPPETTNPFYTWTRQQKLAAIDGLHQAIIDRCWCAVFFFVRRGRIKSSGLFEACHFGRKYSIVSSCRSFKQVDTRDQPWDTFTTNLPHGTLKVPYKAKHMIAAIENFHKAPVQYMALIEEIRDTCLPVTWIDSDGKGVDDDLHPHNYTRHFKSDFCHATLGIHDLYHCRRYTGRDCSDTESEDHGPTYHWCHSLRVKHLLTAAPRELLSVNEESKKMLRRLHRWAHEDYMTPEYRFRAVIVAHDLIESCSKLLDVAQLHVCEREAHTTRATMRAWARPFSRRDYTAGEDSRDLQRKIDWKLVEAWASGDVSWMFRSWHRVLSHGPGVSGGFLCEMQAFAATIRQPNPTVRRLKPEETPIEFCRRMIPPHLNEGHVITSIQPGSF